METVKQNPLGVERIGSLLLRFSIPAIASNLLNAVYNIVDQVFIGHGIGSDGTAATNIAMPLVSITAALSLLIGVGAAAGFNLNLGAGNQEKARRIAGCALSMSVLVGVSLCLVFCAFLTPLLGAFGATAESMGYARDYAFIIAFGIPFQVFTVAACQLIRADGSPNWSMLSMMAGSVFNLIFDPIFMFVFDWGIKGIALATILGQVLSAAIAASYFIRGMKTVRLEKSAFMPRRPNIVSICALGMTGFFNQISITVVTIVLNNTLRYYGPLSRYGSGAIPQGAVGAVNKIFFIVFACVVGLSQGCMPINSFNYGAKQYDRVRRTLKSALFAGLAISCVCFAVLQIFPREITSLFGRGSADPRESALYFQFATDYLRIYMFMVFIGFMQPMASGYFTSTGRAKVGTFMSLTRQILFLIPLLLLFPMLWGIDGVLYAAPVADFAAAALATFLILREMRRLKALTAPAGAPAKPVLEEEAVGDV